MRLVLIPIALAALAACSAERKAAGPERRSAAGEVLGGEVTDDMLPLDTVRSTSPAGQPGAGAAPPARGAGPQAPLPEAQLSAAPLPDMTTPADPEPLRTEAQ